MISNDDIREAHFKEQIEGAEAQAKDISDTIAEVFINSGEMQAAFTNEEATYSVADTYLGQRMPWFRDGETFWNYVEEGKIYADEHLDFDHPSLWMVSLSKPDTLMCPACAYSYGVQHAEKYPGLCDNCNSDGNVEFQEVLIRANHTIIIGNVCNDCSDKHIASLKKLEYEND
jgi:hypothetical protein